MLDARFFQFPTNEAKRERGSEREKNFNYIPLIDTLGLEAASLIYSWSKLKTEKIKNDLAEKRREPQRFNSEWNTTLRG